MAKTIDGKFIVDFCFCLWLIQLHQRHSRKCRWSPFHSINHHQTLLLCIGAAASKKRSNAINSICANVNNQLFHPICIIKTTSKPSRDFQMWRSQLLRMSSEDATIMKNAEQFIGIWIFHSSLQTNWSKAKAEL